MLFLLAEVDQSAAAGWIGLGIAVVAMVGGLAKVYWDKDNAVKLVKLENTVENQGEKLKACEERHDQCEKKGETQERRIQKLELHHGPGRCVPIDTVEEEEDET